MHQMQSCAAFHPLRAMQMQHMHKLGTSMVASMYIMRVNIAKLSQSSHVADVTFKLLAASNTMKISTEGIVRANQAIQISVVKVRLSHMTTSCAAMTSVLHLSKISVGTVA